MISSDEVERQLPENVYGHTKRLRWMISWLCKEDFIIEFGCGTGYMITRPLLKLGYNVLGLDADVSSISLGRKILLEEGLSSDQLKSMDLSELDLVPDVIIASEVFEHIPSDKLDIILKTIHRKLKPGGRLLVTVPNGYGWFEFESFLWYKVGLGKLLEFLRIVGIINVIKKMLGFQVSELPYPSTLCQSPHIQHFTFSAIHKLLNEHGFEVMEFTGSVGFAGPFSNLFFKGIYLVLIFNNSLGKWFPKIAASFYLNCRVSKHLSDEGEAGLGIRPVKEEMR
jgi:SAM-dependent methyltransferase